MIVGGKTRNDVVAQSSLLVKCDAHHAFQQCMHYVEQIVENRKDESSVKVTTTTN